MTVTRQRAGQLPNERELQCALRSQAMRQAAEAAMPIHAERAVVQYGAGAALERAAVAWSKGNSEAARAWERAVDTQLLLALIPIPWPLNS